MDVIHSSFINEFEVDVDPSMDCSSSEVSSDAGSWVQDGLGLGELSGIGDWYCDDEEEEWKESRALLADSQLTQHITTETLRIAPPCVQEIMPALVDEEASMDNSQGHSDEDYSTTVEGASLEPAKLLTTKTYQHNPYRYRVIPCRLTSMPSTAELPANHHHRIQAATENAYETLPLCQCQTAAVQSPPQQATVAIAARKKTMCCYFKQKGTCKMGDACWYGHDGDLYTPCHYGASCKAGHATLTQMVELQSAPTFSQSAAVLASLSGLSVRIGSQLSAPQHHCHCH